MLHLRPSLDFGVLGQMAFTNMLRTAYFWDPIFLEHDTGHHVEGLQRAARLRPENLRRHIPNLDHRPIIPHDGLDWILGLHDRDYHDFVKWTCGSGGGLLDQGDTVVSRRSYDAALAAVDAVLTAADAVAGKHADGAFCAVRPPGHHALPDKAMGFCLFANVAIVARYLQAQHGMKRIAIVDWDVHHGNGTQHFFYNDPDVLFISLHQHPLWPGTGYPTERGEGSAEGTTLNIQIPPFTSEADYLARFEREVLPAVREFRPDFLLISAGFDAHRADPLAQLQLTEGGFARMTEWLKAVAAECCDGRIISCLEGGYDLDALENSATAHVRALMS